MKSSVLLSIYWKENAQSLHAALESVFNQTLSPDEVVLVEDGPIGRELQDVVDDFTKRYNLKVIRLKQNKGLGLALDEGLKHCSNELVVRMDTDDICKPGRFEQQVKFMESHPEIAASSAWIEEFVDNPKNVTSIKKLPETPEEVAEYARSRNPLNHPCAVFRKSAILKVGGYKHWPLFEDYYLWVRLLLNGEKLYNLQKPLLSFRTTPDTFKRRGGWKYACDEFKFQRYLRTSGFITRTQFLKNSAIRFMVRVMPNALRSKIYSAQLRK